MRVFTAEFDIRGKRRPPGKEQKVVQRLSEFLLIRIVDLDAVNVFFGLNKTHDSLRSASMLQPWVCVLGDVLGSLDAFDETENPGSRVVIRVEDFLRDDDMKSVRIRSEERVFDLKVARRGGSVAIKNSFTGKTVFKFPATFGSKRMSAA